MSEYYVDTNTDCRFRGVGSGYLILQYTYDWPSQYKPVYTNTRRLPLHLALADTVEAPVHARAIWSRLHA